MMLNYELKDFYLSLFQKLRYTLTRETKWKVAVNMTDSNSPMKRAYTLYVWLCNTCVFSFRLNNYSLILFQWGIYTPSHPRTQSVATPLQIFFTQCPIPLYLLPIYSCGSLFSIDTKINTNHLLMPSLWRHNVSHAHENWEIFGTCIGL